MVKCMGSNWLITCGRPVSPRLGLPDVPVLRSSGIGANCITIMNAMLSVSRPYTVHMHGRGGVKYPTSISACRALGNNIPKATGYLYQVGCVEAEREANQRVTVGTGKWGTGG